MEQMNAFQLTLTLLLSILLIVSNWRIFIKAGKPGWASLIPIYNVYKQFQIVYGNGWKFLLLLIPLFNIYYAIVFQFRLAKVFGKGTAFGICLWLLPMFYYPILAFGDAEYQGTLSYKVEKVQE